MKFRLSYVLFITGIILLVASIYSITEMNFKDEIVLCEDYAGNKIVDSECINETGLSDALWVLLPGIILFAFLIITGFYLLKLEKQHENMIKRMIENLKKRGLIEERDVFEIK